jgi:hypothetical protein
MADETPTIVVTPIPDGPRRRVQASTNLLHQWVTAVHPNDYAIYELRLGPTPLGPVGYPITPAVEAMLRSSNMYADVVIVEPTQIEVVEAKVVGTPSAVSQLRAYASLVLSTPDLRPYLGRQLVERHLWAVDNALARQMANAAGQVVTIFTPPWIENYLQTKWYRNRSAVVSE